MFVMGRSSEVLVEYHNPFLLRVLECSQSKLFGNETRQQFLAAEFTISADSNRMGYRLEGPRLGTPKRELISEATPTGGIQVLPNGEAILLMADRQTVGGYPKIAVLISADIPKAAQLSPDTAFDFRLFPLRTLTKHLLSSRSVLGWIYWNDDLLNSENAQCVTANLGSLKVA
jgi:antagonist of KipI